MITPRSLARRVMGLIDRHYRKAHRLIPVGPLLLVGRAVYRGPARTFPDGTLLEPGDPIGELHLDNARVHNLDATSSTAVGVAFGRLMFASLRRLAKRSTEDTALSDLKAFHGITWAGPRGHGLGVVSEPVAPSFRRRWQHAYFRLLRWTFSAQTKHRAPTVLPHHYWLTKDMLRGKFLPPASDIALSENQYSKRINGAVTARGPSAKTDPAEQDSQAEEQGQPPIIIDGQPQNLQTRARSKPRSTGPRA